jgi:predicted NAD/FAD-binding protein
MNRLQALDEPVDYCVTLNQTSRICPDSELRRFVYEHPVYTADALDAQRLLPRLSGQQGTAFCGAYHGWGFHEDGCVSGIRAALALGFAW